MGANGEDAVSTVTIAGAPANCKVTDVDVTLRLTEAFGNWSQVSVAHASKSGIMFTGTDPNSGNPVIPCQTGGPFSFSAIMDDDASTRLNDNPNCTEPYGLGGRFKSEANGLNAFDNEVAAGDWTLREVDNFGAWDPTYGIQSFAVDGTCDSITRTRRLTP